MQVALFVTCLIDLLRPQTGFAAVRLLEQLGADVVVPETQTCCGQPTYNNGDPASARKIARQVIAAFEPYTHVVVPSASCGGMIVAHYPELFTDDPDWLARARDLAGRTQELTQFVAEHRNDSPFPGDGYRGRVACHDSCSALRELGVHEPAHRLLHGLEGVSPCTLEGKEQCCGFGGTFSVKYAEISEKIVDAKVDDLIASGADTLVSTDLGCLLNIAGRLSRIGSDIKVFHIADVLAGMTDHPLFPISREHNTRDL